MATEKGSMYVVGINHNGVGEYGYRYSALPKKTTGGNAELFEFNSYLLAVTQHAGRDTTSPDKVRDYLLGLIERDVQQKLERKLCNTRGPVWNTPEQRADFKVTVDGQIYNPDWTPGQLKYQQSLVEEQEKKEAVVETPAISVPTPQIAVPAPQIVSEAPKVLPQASAPVIQTPQISMPAPKVEAPTAMTDSTDNEESIQIGKVLELMKQMSSGAVKDVTNAQLEAHCKGTLGLEKGMRVYNTALARFQAEAKAKASPLAGLNF